MWDNSIARTSGDCNTDVDVILPRIVTIENNIKSLDVTVVKSFPITIVQRLI